MKIVMTLLVRNEEDIIKENLEYHLEHGVDFFVITDHRSTDATSSILNKYRKYGIADVLKFKDDIYPQAAWVTSMARHAATQYKADWVINSDADEFWNYQGGNLKDYFNKLESNICRVHVKRFDFFFHPYKYGNFYESMLFRETVRRWTKCCHRGIDDIRVEMGNHHALSETFDKAGFTEIHADDTFNVFHYPVRDIYKYRQRIIDFNVTINNTPGLDAHAAFHWRMALESIKNGTYEQFVDCFVLNSEKINSGIRNGSLIFDDTMQKLLHNVC